MIAIPESKINNALLHVFTREWTKSQLEKYCDTAIATSDDLAELILAARAGLLEPFLHVDHHIETVPGHLFTTEEEAKSVVQNGVGPVHGKAKRFFAKVFQAFEERRLFSAHLFYTRCHSAWYLLYFDQRDISREQQHWKHGPHMHLLSHHFGRLNLEIVWRQVGEGRVRAGRALHVRYKKRRHSSDRGTTLANGILLPLKSTSES